MGRAEGRLPGPAVGPLVEISGGMAAEALRDVPVVLIRRFDDSDVVRHPLVERVIRAYARHRKGHGA